jgi:chromosome segregation ATPase
MMLISNKMRLPLLLLSLLAAGTAQAQGQKGQSMEERLRAELRNVTAQLQQTRGELELLKAKGVPAAKAAPVAAAPASDGLKKELARSQSQLAQERAQREKLGEQQQRSTAAAQEAAASLAQYRQASEQLAATGKQLEAERARLDGEVVAQRGALARCESKNAQLYAAGQEILQAYEGLDVLGVMRARQPFAAQSRVKLEQIAQQYGDQLYQGRFDARQTETPAAPAPAPQ